MERRALVILLALGALGAACGAPPPPVAAASAVEPAGDAPSRLADDLEVRRLGPGLFLHVSSKETPKWGTVHANGLVLIGHEGALLVDTPWTPEATRALVAWLAARGAVVRDVIVTHFHDDRVGGVPALPATARVHALPATRALAAREGHAFSAEALAPEASLQLAGEPVETYFPGAGHAPDNIVVWLPRRRLLFGGCFVKSAQSEELGNLSDADVASWPTSLERVVARYPSPAVVVPGHGAPGGTELLARTRALVAAALATPR